MTRSECAKLVAILIAAYPSARPTSATTEIYERMLIDLDGVVAAAAVERMLATSKFMPSIAEIRAACLDLTLGEGKAGGEAWGEVLRLISSKGAYRTPGEDFVFADQLVAKCVAALGWKNLCLSEGGAQQAADRARFIELYEKLALGERKRQTASELPNHKRLEETRETSELSDGVAAMVGRLAFAKKAAP
jgi:hypothetical protein